MECTDWRVIYGASLWYGGAVSKPYSAFLLAKCDKMARGWEFLSILSPLSRSAMGGAVIPRSGNWVLDHAALLTVTCLVCYGFAAIFERPLARYRKVVLGLFSRGKLLTTS